ncbi:MAG: hypothetical protein C5B50_29190 [Verrucomicrobia bacterium]|nr:MAG: hypothetical protein C5B50_29190 [Verrucomicrobiota bacterium]
MAVITNTTKPLPASVPARAPGALAARAPAAVPVRVPALFRKIDWLALVTTFGLVFITYMITLGPELTLEDSGELVTGSMYAGIPHPPGYPVWTIYSWLWTVLLPIGNMAWRVSVGEAFAGATACGLLALMVSRGSSLFMEGIEELKSMTGKWEAAICFISGVVAGLLMGLDGFMWRESIVVNRIAVFSVPWMLLMMACLLRWIYAPHQMRYAYLAAFVFGVALTTHQSLVVAALGFVVAIVMGNPRLGSRVLMGAFLVYLAYMVVFLLSRDANGFHHPAAILARGGFFVLFNAVGWVSGVCSILVAARTGNLSSMFTEWKEWKHIILMALLFILGLCFYLYEALAGMSNPPMQWGYPRTVEGFWHALSRGQYEQPNPISLMDDPMRFVDQMIMLVQGVAQEFNWMYILIALLPFFFIFRMQRRERAWLVTLGSMFFFLGVILIMLLNPSRDRASADLIRVFLTSSHAIVACLIGYGLALTAAYMSTHYKRFRPWGFFGGVVAWSAALYCLFDAIAKNYFGRAWEPPIALWMEISGCVLVLVFAPTAYLNYKRSQQVAEMLGREKGQDEVARLNETHRYYASSAAINCIQAAFGVLVWFYPVFKGLLFGSKGELSFGQALHWVGRWTTQAFAKNQYGLPIFAGLFLVAIALVFIGSLLFYRERGPLLITLVLFAAMPLYSGLSHWFDSEQRGHMFGYWFGHDMFTPPFKFPSDYPNDSVRKDWPNYKPSGPDTAVAGKPIFPEMTKDAYLYGGTDPGRFCPTYMVFVESFTPHDCQPEEDQKFDRRDVYIVTQNALADGTYLNYIRAHYNRSEQKDPPFFADLVRSVPFLHDSPSGPNFLTRAVMPLDTLFEGIGERIEKQRRTYTSWFTEKDFVDMPSLAAKLRPSASQDPLSKYIYENIRPETRHLIDSSTDPHVLARTLAPDLNQLLDRELQIKKKVAAKQAEKTSVDETLFTGTTSPRLLQRQKELEKDIADLNAIGPLYKPELFNHVQLSEYLQDFIKENPQSHTRVRLNRLLLEAAYPKEIAKSLGGVYPDREVYIATPEDSQKCFQEYVNDFQERIKRGQRKPNEETKIENGQVSVIGQTAVMTINGFISKVMFDHNPKNEFYVEESFPLDWMYPHLTPYGIIMKINRPELPDLREEDLRRDHEFWKQYSKRLCGDWIDYDTSVKSICDWVEKTYLRRDFTGYKGDPKFVRDEDGQKAFSKLRSSIGGIYSWRLGYGSPGASADFQPKTPAQRAAVYREADFAFKQAFAFCPFSPEAVFRYTDVLVRSNRLDDAILVMETCLKMDPYNGGVQQQLNNFKNVRGQVPGGQDILPVWEEEFKKNPGNAQLAFGLANAYYQQQQTDSIVKVMDGLLNSTQKDPRVVLGIINLYQQQLPTVPPTKLEAARQAYARLMPNDPDSWFELARLRSTMGKTTEAVADLRKALDLASKLPPTDTKARDIKAAVQSDPRFAALRAMPEVKTLIGAN